MKKRWLTGTLFALMIISSLMSLFMPLEYVRGHSMAPTLKPGQWIVVMNTKLARTIKQPVHRGDLITFRNDGLVKQIPAQRLLVKRVIGMPGDLIGINRTTVYRNGQALKEPYVKYPMANQHYNYDGQPAGGALFADASFQRTTLVKAHQYFVLGDNRPRSADSRWFGPIATAQVASKVLWRLPFNNQNWWVRGLWYLAHALPLLFLLSWFALAYGNELIRLLRGNQ
ncbi:signal peptidase I [Lacticaseibacillus suibinensis]|uniref:signal peptidase I n=1 Tax=Lacticaseibacillus suibinensis TaxID=2486011 RepID=UPI000F776A62|nr:signal peptidase I [Lacticaseibacillus suibinensis]